MDFEEFQEMMDWLCSLEPTDIDIEDMARIAVAFDNLNKALKPVYLKHKMQEEGGMGFLFRL